MNGIKIFEDYAPEYDSWYENKLFIYRAELAAVKSAIPDGRVGLEVGVGTGRFASMLNIYYGIEPSGAMAHIAQKRGINVIRGYAEKLPFPERLFDFLLFVTTICFLNEPLIALQEAHRVLKLNGKIIIGFIDKNSEIGSRYQKKRGSNKFYKNAGFLSVDEMVDLLKTAGFSDFKFYQTLVRMHSNTIEIPQIGFGKGSFVVVQGAKK
jgi:ubiquinone/menaquinone biosynthesis C-methylase UbiE